MRNSPQRPTPLEGIHGRSSADPCAMFIQIAIQLDHSPSIDFRTTEEQAASGDGRWRKCGGRSLPVAYGRYHFSGSERVILQFNTVQTPRFPGFRHNAAFHNMQRMQLYAVHAGFNHSLQRFANIQPALRQAGRQLSGNTPSARADVPAGLYADNRQNHGRG